MKFYKGIRVFLLRPTLLGTALGLVWTTFVVVFTLISMQNAQASQLSLLFELTYPGYALTGAGLLVGAVWAFIYGYLAGYAIGFFYSFFVIQKAKKLTKFIFEVDYDKRVNLVQAGAGAKPYTIVFVANPAIYIKSDEAAAPDPIIRDKTTFYKVVMRCMKSFAHNELLGLPEIKSRLRIVTIFDETRISASDPSNALCEDLDELTTVIAPRFDEDNPTSVRDYVQNTNIDDARLSNLDDVDVIYAISASENLTRSAARFSEEEEGDGTAFTITLQDPTTLENVETTMKHVRTAARPGVIALAALDERLKVPVHEFAHAMSSIENGVIYDEYVDRFHDDEEADPSDLKGKIINRMHRKSSIEPVPDVFAKYTIRGETTTYSSDRHRTDKPADWTSYTPEKDDIATSCTMDHTYYSYRFDKLIFDFMYDRMMAKMNRE